MGYWKREYTERKAVKPLFKPEPKEAAPADQSPSDTHADSELPPPAEAPEPSH
jgi:hypothetical protein